METPARAKCENSNKMIEGRFALSNQTEIKCRKKKTQNTLKVTQTWLTVWLKWTTERIIREKLEECDHEQLNNLLQVTEVFTLHCRGYNKQNT